MSHPEIHSSNEKNDKFTVSRELCGNRVLRSSKYYEKLAQRKYKQRQTEKPLAVKFTDAVKAYVTSKLAKNWSLEQISKSPSPIDMNMVSHVRHIPLHCPRQKKGGELYKHLRRRKKYKRRCVVDDRRGKLANTKSIHERPPEANDRSRYSNYKVDLIVGANHHGGLLTTNDHKTGIVKIREIENKNSAHIDKLIISALKAEKKLVYTITFDNSREFADYVCVSKQLGIDLYFTDSYSSWQRGSNENLNGLILQYFPKKTNFDTVSYDQVKEIEQQLNNRPRKRFGFRTSIHEFYSLTKVAFSTCIQDLPFTKPSTTLNEAFDSSRIQVLWLLHHSSYNYLRG